MKKTIYEIYKVRSESEHKREEWRYHGNHDDSEFYLNLKTLGASLADDMINVKKAYPNTTEFITRTLDTIVSGNLGNFKQFSPLDPDELAKLVSEVHKEYEKLIVKK